MKQMLKFIGILILILAFLVNTFLVRLLVWSPWKFRKRIQKLNAFYCRAALRVLSVKTRWEGEYVDVFKNNFFMVSNHLSYLDVLVLYSRIPACFVTSREMREAPVLGQITYLAGCIFVERRSKQRIHSEINEISEALRHGLNSMVFPEATSTNGDTVLPFKRSLFQSAIISQKPVLPITLNYNKKEIVSWYGDMDFIPHLWKLCGAKNIECRVVMNSILRVIPSTDSTALCEFSWQRVSSSYVPAASIKNGDDFRVFI